MAKTNKLEDMEQELLFIQSIDPESPGQVFNHDPSCFARYCDMQARQALGNGHNLIAEDMLKMRDIAINHTGLIHSVWLRENNGYSSGKGQYRIAYFDGELEHVMGEDERQALNRRMRQSDRVVKIECLNIDEYLHSQLFN